MKRKFRLTRSTDIKRVRHHGRSYAHPLIVLVAAPSSEPVTRFGVVAGRTVGGAVERNRCKRLMRSAVDMLLPLIVPGWDVLLLARKGLEEVDCSQVRSALENVLTRARLLAGNRTAQ